MYEFRLFAYLGFYQNNESLGVVLLFSVSVSMMYNISTISQPQNLDDGSQDARVPSLDFNSLGMSGQRSKSLHY